MIEYSGYRWKVRNNKSSAGPGPNLFSGKNVRVDVDGLHLAITQIDGVWQCAQVGGGLKSFGALADISFTSTAGSTN